MAVEFAPTKRFTKGSPRWLYKEVKPNGDDLEPEADTWHQGPAIKESGLKDDTAEEAYETEDGQEYSTDGKRSVEWTGNFVQNDPDTKSLLTVTMRGKTYAILKEESVVVIDDEVPYLYMPCARAIPSTDRKNPGGDIPFKFKPQALTSSQLVSLSGITGTTGMKGTFTGSVALAAGDSYKDFSLAVP